MKSYVKRYSGGFKVYPINDHFVDVRSEEEYPTEILIEDGEIKHALETPSSGIFIRILKNNRWFMTSTVKEQNIKAKIRELDELFGYSHKETINLEELLNPINESVIKYELLNPSKINLSDKIDLLKEYESVIKEYKEIETYRILYNDKYLLKRIKNSIGTDVEYDKAICGFTINFRMRKNENTFFGRFSLGNNAIEHLKHNENKLIEYLQEAKEFLSAKPIKSGIYRTILSEAVAGLLIHEALGHRSESDFIISQEDNTIEWPVGKRVANRGVNIVDFGGMPASSGYSPFDDEGLLARKTYLIKDGRLNSRLHSLTTASQSNEEPTGNARSIDAEHEPIVRMTNTFIESGKVNFKDMMSDIKEGIYIKTVDHCFGISTYVLVPQMAYLIRNGKLREPVKISSIKGSIFKTLKNIEDVSNDFKLIFNVQDGCNKVNQKDLSVGFGGAKIKIKKMKVE